MKVLKGYVQNSNCLEGCIVECYIVEETLEFCMEYLSSMDAYEIPCSMKDEWKCEKPLLGGHAITIYDYKLVEHTYNLFYKIQPLCNVISSVMHLNIWICYSNNCLYKP